MGFDTLCLQTTRFVLRRTGAAKAPRDADARRTDCRGIRQAQTARRVGVPLRAQGADVPPAHGAARHQLRGQSPDDPRAYVDEKVHIQTDVNPRTARIIMYASARKWWRARFDDPIPRDDGVQHECDLNASDQQARRGRVVVRPSSPQGRPSPLAPSPRVPPFPLAVTLPPPPLRGRCGHECARVRWRWPWR